MKKSEFVSAIEKVNKGIAKSSLSSTFDSILFDSTSIRSFNDLISVTYPFNTGVSCAVKGAELLKVISKFSGDEITVQNEEKKLVFSIEGRRSTLRLAKLEASKTADLQRRLGSLELEKLNWVPITVEFNEAVQLGLLCATKKSGSKTVNLIGVCFTDGDIIATDNIQIFRYTTGIKFNDPFVVDAEELYLMTELSKKFQFAAVTQNWFHLKDEEGLIVSAKIRSAVPYPIADIRALFSAASKTDAVYEFPPDLKDALERVEILASVDDVDTFKNTPVCSVFRDGTDLVVKASKEQVGEIEERVPWTTGQFPDNLEMLLPPTILKKILAKTNRFASTDRNTLIFTAGNLNHLLAAKKLFTRPA